MTEVWDQPEPPNDAKAMVTILYDEIIREQNRNSSLRVELAEAVTAGNASRVGVVNMQWFGSRAKLTLLYQLWSQFTGEEFIP